MTESNYIDDFFRNNKETSLQINNFARISKNILDIDPVPIYIVNNIQHASEINNEFSIIASNYDEKNLYIDKNQDSNKDFGIFISQNAYVPYNNILSIENNMYIDLLKDKITSGISELLMTIYNFNGDYKYNIINSWIQKYKNGTFLSPHNHISKNSSKHSRGKTFSVAYYIDDGDPDVSQTYSGCISFITHNNKLVHIRPSSGTLLIWEDKLIHLVNPFYGKSDKERFMLSTNIYVEI